MIFLIPRIGIVNVLFLGLAGQMIVSVAIDSFGLFGLKQQPLSLVKISGVFVILIGVGLLNYDAKKIRDKKTSESNQADAQLTIVGADYISDLRNRRARLILRKQHKRSAKQLLARRHT